MSEDCLFLNIFVPRNVDFASPLRSTLPVMVWIHGGDFIAGTATKPLYDSRFISNFTHTVVVSVAYRLGKSQDPQSYTPCSSSLTLGSHPAFEAGCGSILCGLLHISQATYDMVYIFHTLSRLALRVFMCGNINSQRANIVDEKSYHKLPSEMCILSDRNHCHSSLKY